VDQVLRVVHGEEERGGEALASADETRVVVDELGKARDDSLGFGRAHGGMIA
jgi:hypothetical protein